MLTLGSGLYATGARRMRREGMMRRYLGSSRSNASTSSCCSSSTRVHLGHSVGEAGAAVGGVTTVQERSGWRKPKGSTPLTALQAVGRGRCAHLWHGKGCAPSQQGPVSSSAKLSSRGWNQEAKLASVFRRATKSARGATAIGVGKAKWAHV